MSITHQWEKTTDMTYRRRPKDERFKLSKKISKKRYVMPARIDAHPEEIARGILSIRGYAKRAKS